MAEREAGGPGGRNLAALHAWLVAERGFTPSLRSLQRYVDRHYPPPRRSIVGAVREQSRASGHVVELMERVREGVEAIGRAAAEQERGTAVIGRSAGTMREVAAQVRGTTEEQARGSGRIRESVEGVREAMERINQALQEQSAACRSAAEFLEAVWQRTQSNEHSAGRLDAVAHRLAAEARSLRQHVQRFRL